MAVGEGIVWATDPRTTRVTFISSQAERIFGYRREAWHAEGFWSDHVYPEDQARLLRFRTAQVDDGVDNIVENRMLAADGTVLWVSDSSRVVGSGADARLVGMLFVVGGGHGAELAWEKSDSAFTHNVDGMVVTDKSGLVLHANLAFSALTGRAAHEVEGKESLDALLGSRDDIESVTTVAQTRDFWSGEWWCRRPSGHSYLQQATVIAVKKDVGEISGYIGVFRDLSHEKSLLARQKKAPCYDPLTGLLTPAGLKDRLRDLLVSDVGTESQLAVMAIELNQLDYLLRAFGHGAGDRFLTAVAHRMSMLASDIACVGRDAGDTFVMIVQHRDGSDFFAFAKTLVHELSLPFSLGQHEVNAKPQLGIAISPAHGTTAELLISHAHTALQKAKNEGREIQDFRDESVVVHSRTQQLRTQIAVACKRSEFRLVYEAQRQLGSRKIIAAEALLRWKHPTLGEILPANVIKLAEEEGHITEIGMWVLKQACAQIRRWQEMGHTQLRATVNVSLHQLLQADFAPAVMEVLHETRLAPEFLELELVGGGANLNSRMIETSMVTLANQGITLVLDNFGAESAFLTRLCHWPVKKVKIDRTLTQHIHICSRSNAVIQSLIALAQGLGVEIVAVGVETADQERFLDIQGCHAIQGNAVNRPLPGTDFQALLERDAIETTRDLVDSVPVQQWASTVYGSSAPGMETLRSWIREGKIVPEPLKVGRKWLVPLTARYMGGM
ncbi:hypothetical protein AYR66_01920 [Noviherbaspirillum denitrificans]|uniref:Diguanylate cyclase n=2 Tax=Noviherbaspirillum denitrificans TaxID=1968433 RepID=A0A254T6U9_9BURK|nr:hypothetical protein AYR66_01920 [Noviherbaspirillum denitrificans]